MATKDEEKVYSELMQNAPAAEQSAATQESASALQNAEHSTAPGNYSGGTADAQLDAAINKWLNSRGFNYNTADDKDYQDYVKQFKQNAETGRQLSRQTAKTLANGYNPTYADTVADEVYNQQMANVTDAIPTFRNLAAQQYNAEQSMLGNAVNLYGTQSQKDYSRYRDTVSDNKNFLNYLYDRYVTDRQGDVQNDANRASIYGTQLSAAQSNLAEARNYDNQRYLYNTQSADSRAQIAEQEYENNQKIAYNKAQDEYEAKVAAEKEKGNTQNANAVFAGMKDKSEFNNPYYSIVRNKNASEVYPDRDGLKSTEEYEEEIKNLPKSEKKYDESGNLTYEAYAKDYIDNQLKIGNIDADERDYLYRKVGITGEDDNYYNSGIADSFIKTYELDVANDNYIKTQLAIGYNKGQITLEDMNYISKKLGIKL